ncbi:MAG: hypothetical protein H8E25_09275 [Planctomycetes bacterium]|nr:hypothetical protein [Planctomycetota bacterium]
MKLCLVNSQSLWVQRGAALIIVLMSLALLFALGVPFLFASRVRSESSNEAIYRVQARVAAQSASKYISLEQAQTHPALDATPLYDAPSEWDGSSLGPLPQSLGEQFSRSRESWGVEIESMQSKISLATAPTMLLQNLVHPCYLTRSVSHAETTLPVTSTAGFPDSGVLSISGNWVVYGAKNANEFLEIAADLDPPGDLDNTRFREGRFVADPRVQAIALSNLDIDGYSPPEFYADALEFDFGDQNNLLPAADREYLQQLSCLSSGAYGAAWWQPGSFMNRELDYEQPDLVSIDSNLLVNAGSYVRLENNEQDVFESLVLASNGNVVRLASEVPEEFTAFNTRVMPLSREPVDINSCRPEILQALVTGLQLRTLQVASTAQYTGDGNRDWVTPSEASAVARAILDARPLQGPDDLWERVLAPLALEQTISDVDSWMIFLNSIDPNHAWLRQSTTGFGYRAGLKFQQRVNAAVRSRLGRTLARSSAKQVLQVAPAGQLLEVVHNQLRFEDYSMWQRGMHGVSSLPNDIGSLATQFCDSTASISKRLGTIQNVMRMQPDAEPEISALIPTPARTDNDAPYGGSGLTDHFDYTESPLGYEFDTHGPLFTTTGDWNIGDGVISDDGPLHIQGWFFANSTSDSTLFDYTSDYTDRNRISASFEQGELVVRCYGTHGEDSFDIDGLSECITTRIDLAEHAIDGRWFHLSALLRNESARGFQVCLDGVPRGEIDGFTHLTQAVAAHVPGSPSEIIAVESTAGFPSRGAIRIGNEVIEYSAITESTFITERSSSDFIGGRAARDATDELALSLDSSHPMGSAVEVYGYSSILLGDIAPGGFGISGDVGPWSVANCAAGVEDIITVRELGVRPFPIGKGISASYLGPIELSVCDQAPSDLFFSEAFQSDGGYALIWQAGVQGMVWGLDGSSLLNIDDESRIAGMEVIKYSSRIDNTLTISERNVVTPGIEDAPTGVIGLNGTSFVMEFEDYITVGADGLEANESLPHNVYIMPIGVRASGASSLTYPQPTASTHSAFVQIAANNNPGNTEWVRYDNIIDGDFLRDEYAALFRVISQVSSQETIDGGPGGPPSPAAGGQDGASDESSTTLWQDPLVGSDYLLRPVIGVPEDKEDFINIMESEYSFRGVNGTFDHAHQSGEKAIPVFKTLRAPGAASLYSDPGYGFIGRLDRVAIMQAGETSDPLWFEVQWATPARIEDTGADPTATYVAFSEHPGLPFLGSDLTALSQSMDGLDLRNYNRIVKFPNFERPSSLAFLNVGVDSAGLSPAFSGFVDEFAVHSTGGFGSPSDFFSCGGFYLDEDLTQNSESFVQVNEFDFSLNNYRVSIPNATAGDYLNMLPPSGIIDIDGERIAYSSIEGSSGQINIAPNGRGLHGTEQRGHASGARVRIVDGRLATALNSDLDAGSHTFELEDSSTLSQYSMLLIDEELIFAPMRGRGLELAMPRLRDDVSDQAGNGTLRGRFGTAVSSHSAGVIAYDFPTRWLDLYAPQSNSGLSAWYQFSMTQPNAYWRSIGFEVEGDADNSQVQLLVRSGDADFEDDPSKTHYLKQFDKSSSSASEMLELGFLSDHIDFRFMFDWQPGAFDAIDFNAYGWTQAPRIRQITVDYLAETVVTQDSEVVE